MIETSYQNESGSGAYEPTARTEFKRLPARGSYDRALVHSILDEAFVCHVGFVGDGGQPFVIPTAYARIDDTLYVHGSPASRTLRTMRGGVDVCITVTLVDGLVLARSAFHHSINFRSVVILGRAHVVEDMDEKLAAMEALVDHVLPGRTADSRRPAEKELKATLVLTLPIVEASAKVRTGHPVDDEEDMELPVWAGYVPLSTTAGAPVADEGTIARGWPVPQYARSYGRVAVSRGRRL